MPVWWMYLCVNVSVCGRIFFFPFFLLFFCFIIVDGFSVGLPGAESGDRCFRLSQPFMVYDGLVHFPGHCALFPFYSVMNHCSDWHVMPTSVFYYSWRYTMLPNWIHDKMQEQEEIGSQCRDKNKIIRREKRGKKSIVMAAIVEEEEEEEEQQQQQQQQRGGGGG